jgi:hypothetical protein
MDDHHLNYIANLKNKTLLWITVGTNNMINQKPIQ